MKKIIAFLLIVILMLVACDVDVSVKVGDSNANATSKRQLFDTETYVDEDGCEYIVFTQRTVNGMGVGSSPKVIQPAECKEKMNN